jgi:hypothetical protein
MPLIEENKEEYLDQHADHLKHNEFRKKIGFMLSIVNELMKDGLISSFSILE